MVVRGWDGNVIYGIFKRLKDFPFKINEMALLRENHTRDTTLIAYKIKDFEGRGKRRKITILQIGITGVYFSYLWGAARFDIEEDPRNRCVKVVGIDEV
jgi:hypothetical protein